MARARQDQLFIPIDDEAGLEQQGRHVGAVQYKQMVAPVDPPARIQERHLRPGRAIRRMKRGEAQSPRGQLVGAAAGDRKDEVIVRDLDMGQLQEVRDLWQFYRDRRPDQYGPLAQA